MSYSAPSSRVMLTRLWPHISRRRRIQFGLLFVLIIVASVTEIFSIGALLPFLAVLTDPERVFKNAHAQFFVSALGVTSPAELMWPITLTFIVAVCLAGAVRLFLIWATAEVTFATGADLSISIYRRTLYQPYAVHVSRNSSEIISGITAKSYRLIHNAIMPALTIASSAIMLVMILSALLAVNPELSLYAFGGFAAIYILIIKIVKKKLVADSRLISTETTKIIKALQEGLGGIRDVLIDGLQEAYCEVYRQAEIPLRRAQASNAFIANSPRLVIEALGMLFISLLAYTLSKSPEGLVMAIPSLGVMAMGAQRLLPILQQSYGAWVSLHGEISSVLDAIDLLDQPLPEKLEFNRSEMIPFERAIELKNLSFGYSGSETQILKNINLILTKGWRVGIIGATGSGKSTLLDMVMGLLVPTSGSLEVDGLKITETNRRRWQAHISHGPQNIFLADCSIEENIAFGVPKSEIDFDRVRDAARRAQIAETIEALPDKYRSSVGERGVKISGGQRQRIGIARALYKQANVIVFDEATNALDGATEEAVMGSLDNIGSDITVIMIAHRLSTLKNCHQIIELRDGQINRCLSYSEISSETKA